MNPQAPRPTLRLLALVIALAVLPGCAGTPDKKEEPQETAAEMYRRARLSLESGSYEFAITELRRVQARYPFDPYAIQAHLDLIYVHYLKRDAEAAVDEADRFIRENPRHPNVAYAYYMKGLAYFEPEVSFVTRWYGVNPAGREPTNAHKSFQNFKLLVETFPDSEYAEDARQRMVFLYNRLAEYEYLVADYYLRRGAYVAAVNRAKYLVENFPRAASVPPALEIMTHAYRRMGLEGLADQAAATLRASFPDYLPRRNLDEEEQGGLLGWFRRLFD
ncbi:MAG TPA: outer membrane protein assembly factor BamD [Gammaproteobacteria bacterium]|nr:outer membrane protein assembly factor BamD [Gammaproteobacteria bacterium]